MRLNIGDTTEEEGGTMRCSSSELENQGNASELRLPPLNADVRRLKISFKFVCDEQR
jgi:hypothetical protein